MAGVVATGVACLVVGGGLPALAASPAAGRAAFELEELPAELAGRWDFRTGDDPAWSSENLAETGWSTVPVPGSWEEGGFAGYDGHAWYRVWIRPAATLPDEPLGVSFYRIRDADEVFLNGERVGATGGFPPDFKKATLYQRSYRLPERLLRRGDWNLLAVHVYNHIRPGGILGRPPTIDRYEALLRQDSRTALLVVAMFVILVMTAASHLFLFVHRREARENLYFALLCLSMGWLLLTYLQGFSPPGLDISGLFRTNVAAYLAGILFFTAFLHAFFGVPLSRWVRPVPWLLGAAMVAALFWPDLDRIYLPVVIGDASAAYLFLPLGAVLVAQVRRRAPYARWMAGVLGLFMITVIYDVLIDLAWVRFPGYGVAGVISPLAFIGLCFTLGFILARRYWGYYRTATVDPLTGLLQRQFFLTRLSEELDRGEREGKWVAVALLDVDGFKAVNDEHGHPVGDRVLQALAAAIRSAVRPFDLVGRYGGDELCLAVVGLESALAGHDILERVRAGVARCDLGLPGSDRRLTASVGALMLLPEGGEEVGTLLEDADRELLRAKREGKDRVVWAPRAG